MMKRLLGIIGATIGSALGWWIGVKVGFVTGFMLSVVGTGLGLFYGNRFSRHYLP